jgi:serine/threonine-protein kinase
MLTTVGLVVGVVRYDYSDSVAAGVVLSQDPVGGASVPAGSSVDLVVSLGQPVVPDVRGMTEEDANTVMNAVDDLRIGEVTYQYSDTVAAGLVLIQAGL